MDLNGGGRGAYVGKKKAQKRSLCYSCLSISQFKSVASVYCQRQDKINENSNHKNT